MELVCFRGIGTGLFTRLDEKRHPPFGIRLEGGFFYCFQTTIAYGDGFLKKAT
jgi:hypothetical protein